MDTLEHIRAAKLNLLRAKNFFLKGEKETIENYDGRVALSIIEDNMIKLEANLRTEFDCNYVSKYEVDRFIREEKEMNKYISKEQAESLLHEGRRLFEENENIDFKKDVKKEITITNLKHQALFPVFDESYPIHDDEFVYYLITEDEISEKVSELDNGTKRTIKTIKRTIYSNKYSYTDASIYEDRDIKDLIDYESFKKRAIVEMHFIHEEKNLNDWYSYDKFEETIKDTDLEKYQETIKLKLQEMNADFSTIMFKKTQDSVFKEGIDTFSMIEQTVSPHFNIPRKLGLRAVLKYSEIGEYEIVFRFLPNKKKVN